MLETKQFRLLLVHSQKKKENKKKIIVSGMLTWQNLDYSIIKKWLRFKEVYLVEYTRKSRGFKSNFTIYICLALLLCLSRTV